MVFTGTIFEEGSIAGRLGGCWGLLETELAPPEPRVQDNTKGDFDASSTEESWVVYDFFCSSVTSWPQLVAKHPGQPSQWDREEIGREKAVEMKTG